jgi:hypothetical protein
LSSKHIFDAISVLLNRLLSPHLKTLEHIANSTEDVFKLLDRVKCVPHTALIKIDVKEFFSSGSHSVLVSPVANAFTGTLRRAVAGSLWLVLTRQLLKDFVEDSDVVWATVKGSGMGARHSPRVSDFACNQTAEKILLSSLRFYSVSRYIRYCDDALVVAPSNPRAEAFFRHFKGF